MLEVGKTFSLEKLQEIFKIPFEHYGQVTHYHYKVLFNSKFRSIYRDHVLEVGSDFEYGWQETEICADGKLYYLKFYDLLMLDYDGLSYEEVIMKLTPFKTSFNFRIYQTYNGYHVYITSELINHKLAAPLMKALDCDFFYIKFVHDNGFKIRLSKKLGREESFLEEFGSELNGATDDQVQLLLKVRARFLGAP